ncbi:Copper Transporter integral membrane protein that functions in high affinity copper transport [Scheffersomyces spartinae]|uniref:Copper transport protein n=1 Tax=Scheffersomyces spartinae TaxID=45513 RepID=A0A9P8AIW7_9ASCO|nr:Copper Transporter integral membrane protein that functions in high affinity copper transport [Scheffersomyces spartinae]KAG7194833.1 Copper Transporter integral membrane protein that functions in high affinity copper transport [Scheffersomyces spartinae]
MSMSSATMSMASATMSMASATASSSMSMGMKKGGCKISMLWNWNTVDSCFIAKSWKVSSKGSFAGSCIGVFFLCIAAQWLHRFCREYDIAIGNKYVARTSLMNGVSEEGSNSSYDEKKLVNAGSSPTLAKDPLVYTLSHKWLFTWLTDATFANAYEHLVRTLLFTVEWGLSYFIMLLFMYYNGYIIICCILGTMVGRLLFTYNEPLVYCGQNVAAADSHDADRKCCR